MAFGQVKTFTFYTKTGFRQDVEAPTPKLAWFKIQSMPGFREQFTGYFGIYDKNGLMPTGQIDGCVLERCDHLKDRISKKAYKP